MRSLGSRVLIGLGILAAAVMTIGYAFIFSDIADPPGGDRGALEVPPAGEARAARLDDGTPVYVVNVDDSVGVIDARGRGAPGELAGMVAWCRDTRTFVDLTEQTLYAADGAVIDGDAGGGLSVLASRLDEEAQRVIVGAGAGYAGATARPFASARCLAPSWITHEAEAEEVFDPSVAADQEPPGWIWVEGSLVVVDGTVRLCDGSASACGTSAEVRGIDPASLQAFPDGRVEGQFIGRVRDGALEGLMFVPDTGGPS